MVPERGPTAAHEGREQGPTIEIRVEQPPPAAIASHFNREAFADLVRKAMQRMAAPVGRIDVLIVADASMRVLHRRYSGLDSTTDVLTFLSSLGKGPMEVDIVVCADEAGRQAAERGHGAERELLLYVVHGLLHCMGHDDHDPESFERMHAEEDRILADLGVGPVFRPAGGGPETASGRTP